MWALAGSTRPFRIWFDLFKGKRKYVAGVLTLTQQGIEILQSVFGEAFFVVARFTRSERLMVKLPPGASYVS